MLRPQAVRRVLSYERLRSFSRDAAGRGSRPRIVLKGRELDWSLSISHNERGVLAVLCTADACSLGVDLASKTARSAGFLRLWFTLNERRWIAADPARRTAIVWAMKEATYKACQAGESWSPRDIEIRALCGNRFACIFQDRLLQPLWTDVLEIDDQIAALVCLPRTSSRQIEPSRPARTLAYGRTPHVEFPVAC